VTRTAGMVFVGVGLLACLVGTAVLGVNLAQGQLRADAAILGFALLAVVIVAPLVGVGAVTLARGRTQVKESAAADAMRKLLDMVKTRGKLNVSDAVIEMQSDLPAVQDMIYRLVGMGVFDGYVNWDEGVLYSADASSLHDMTQCKHCGGNLTLAGKGVVKCPYCGTEYFLSR